MFSYGAYVLGLMFLTSLPNAFGQIAQTLAF
jgi:hypothetical protein